MILRLLLILVLMLATSSCRLSISDGDVRNVESPGEEAEEIPGWIAKPEVQILFPKAGQTVSSETLNYTGLCTDGIPVEVTYGFGASGPSTVDCVSGNFTFTVLFEEASGSREVTVSQTNLAGTNESSVKLAFFNSTVSEVKPASDGSLFVAGYFSEYEGQSVSRIVKILPDGTLDKTFDGPGEHNFEKNREKLMEFLGLSDSVLADDFPQKQDYEYFLKGLRASITKLELAQNEQDQMYVITSLQVPQQRSKVGLYRLKADGSFDFSFNPSQALLSEPKSLLSNGEILWVGTRDHLYLFDTDGTPLKDMKFGSGTVLSMVPATDGSSDIFVGGSFGGLYGELYGVNGNFSDYTHSPGFIRLTQTGQVSALHRSLGFFRSVQVRGFVHMPNGDLIVGGDFENYNRHETDNLLRIRSDGSPVREFSATMPMWEQVWQLAFDPKFGLYVGGFFTEYNGSPTGALLRVDPKTAKRDPLFHCADASTFRVFSLALSNDRSQILVGSTIRQVQVGYVYVPQVSWLNQDCSP